MSLRSSDHLIILNEQREQHRMVARTMMPSMSMRIRATSPMSGNSTAHTAGAGGRGSLILCVCVCVCVYIYIYI